MEYIRKGLEQR